MMVDPLRISIALSMLGLLAAPALAVEAHYSCGDGTRLTADFSGDPTKLGSVVLAFAGSGQVTLPQAVSADGGRYEAEGIEFWVKGNEATLTRNGTATACRIE